MTDMRDEKITYTLTPEQWAWMQDIERKRIEMVEFEHRDAYLFRQIGSEHMRVGLQQMRLTEERRDSDLMERAALSALISILRKHPSEPKENGETWEQMCARKAWDQAAAFMAARPKSGGAT
jgi:hypothetical protein